MERAKLRQPVALQLNGATAGLVVGDIVSFLVFSALGRNSHGEAAGLGALLDVAKTAAPFMLGWFVVASLVGALRGDLLRQPGTMLTRTALAWLIAWPLGLLLRALFLQRGIPWTFVIVVGITNTILLLGWRGLAAYVIGRRTR